MRVRLFGFALVAILIAASSTVAMAGNFRYNDNPCCHAAYPYSVGGNHACHRTHGHCGATRACGDVKVIEDTTVVQESCAPDVHRRERHVDHTTVRVHNVIHEVVHPVEIENVTVHHNIQKEKTIHHYKHSEKVSERDIEKSVDEKVDLGEHGHRDCR